MASAPEPIDYQAMTQRQQATWATGDFNEIGHQVVPVSEALCQSVDPRPSQRVLDVACGSGNAALIFARRYCDVTGIDFVPALIDRAQARAVAEGMHIDFRVGDAQALPFSDATFDVVISVFGVVFAPDQERAASELLRVCRPGGNGRNRRKCAVHSCQVSAAIAASLEAVNSLGNGGGSRGGRHFGPVARA